MQADATLVDAWSDRTAWQRLLERQYRLFEPMVRGAAVGFVSREATESGRGTLLAWVKRDDGMQVETRAFGGFADCGVGVLFVVEPGALEALHARLDDNAIGAMKMQLRHGSLLLYVISPKKQLLDEGYEDFLEALGLAFLGACR